MKDADILSLGRRYGDESRDGRGRVTYEFDCHGLIEMVKSAIAATEVPAEPSIPIRACDALVRSALALQSRATTAPVEPIDQDAYTAAYMAGMARMKDILKQTTEQPAEPSADAKDAERYRWLRGQFSGVDFHYGDAPRTVLIFDSPDGISFCRDCDQNVDAAIAAAHKSR